MRPRRLHRKNSLVQEFEAGVSDPMFFHLLHVPSAAHVQRKNGRRKAGHPHCPLAYGVPRSMTGGLVSGIVYVIRNGLQ
jgi:hypothetical protein